MKLGIGTYTYAWAIGVPGYIPPQPMDALALIRRSAELGVRLVQIADNLPLDTLDPTEFDLLLAEARRHDVELEVGTRGIYPDHLLHYLDIALRCGSSLLRTLVDTHDHHPEPDEVIEMVSSVMPEFEQANVTLAVENHDRFKSKTLAQIVEAVGSSHLGICLDTANSFGAMEGPDVVIESLGPYVVNLHMKDFTIHRVEYAMGFIVEGAPAGQGMLDIPRLLGRLQGYQRDFNTILELWPIPENDLETTIAKEDAWAVESVRYLRNYIAE